MAYIENLTMEELQQKGKEEYDLYSAKNKIDTLVKKGRINTNFDSVKMAEECIRNHEPFCAYTVGTTGIRPDDEIMQIGIASYVFNENEGCYVKDDCLYDIVRASDNALTHYKADYEKNMDKYRADLAQFRAGNRKLEPKKPELYDIFKEGGFGRPVAENGNGLTEQAYREVLQVYLPDVVPGINKFIEKHKDALFFGLNTSFSDRFFIPNGIDVRFIKKCDILDVIREYDCRSFSLDDGKALNHKDNNYGLAEVIGQYDCRANNGDYKLYTCMNKNDAIASILKLISDREKLLETTKAEVKAEVKAENKGNIACYTDKKVNPHSLSAPVEGEFSTNLKFRGRHASEIGKQAEAPSEEKSPEVSIAVEVSSKENGMPAVEIRAEEAKVTEAPVTESMEGLTKGEEPSAEMMASLEMQKAELKAKDELLQKMLDKLVEAFMAVEEISRSNKELVTTVKNMSRKITSLEKFVVKKDEPEKEVKAPSKSRKVKTAEPEVKTYIEVEKLPDKDEDDYER